eukprot:891186-Alexandrium_andersonii.AAC.1
MSASLVGSEMCIRDRPRGDRGPPVPDPDTHTYAYRAEDKTLKCNAITDGPKTPLPDTALESE